MSLNDPGTRSNVEVVVYRPDICGESKYVAYEEAPLHLGWPEVENGKAVAFVGVTGDGDRLG